MRNGFWYPGSQPLHLSHPQPCRCAQVLAVPSHPELAGGSGPVLTNCKQHADYSSLHSTAKFSSHTPRPKNTPSIKHYLLASSRSYFPTPFKENHKDSTPGFSWVGSTITRPDFQTSSLVAGWERLGRGNEQLGQPSGPSLTSGTVPLVVLGLEALQPSGAGKLGRPTTKAACLTLPWLCQRGSQSTCPQLGLLHLSVSPLDAQPGVRQLTWV